MRWIGCGLRLRLREEILICAKRLLLCSFTFWLRISTIGCATWCPCAGSVHSETLSLDWSRWSTRSPPINVIAFFFWSRFIVRWRSQPRSQVSVSQQLFNYYFFFGLVHTDKRQAKNEKIENLTNKKMREKNRRKFEQKLSEWNENKNNYYILANCRQCGRQRRQRWHNDNENVNDKKFVRIKN